MTPTATAMQYLGLGGCLLASSLKLLMPGHNHHLRLLRAVTQLEQHFGRFQNGSVPSTHRVYNLQAQQKLSLG